MRFRDFAAFSFVLMALAGCNDTLDSSTYVDLSTVKNKVEQPLPSHILADMAKKGMDRNSPIMIRILKEEGMMEIWKAKSDNRFDKIAEYKICAWSGRLGPKIKEGDRQAPEGFYNLTPANLNPNSKYYLAINTGFPNRFDAANGRTGANLMIHGACSSSGCYSMTDQQVLEIYAFARDAFKGGQKSVQLQAFPFRMTAENMARHRMSEHFDFWKMLKVGYDNFEVTKRPPEVNVCEKKYVFNQQTAGAGTFNAGGTCPAMTTPAPLQVAMASYEKTYDIEYDKSLKKLSDKVWYDPTEAERKAVVAKLRKGRELAYAPTGSALEAGRLMKISEFAALKSKPDAQVASAAPTSLATAVALGKQPRNLNPVTASTQTATSATLAPTGPATASTIAARMAPEATSGDPETALQGTVPIPTPNPKEVQTAQAETPVADTEAKKKPFWKFWSAQ